jgi:hypothetical protein
MAWDSNSGNGICMCRKTVKTFPMGRDRTNLRTTWLCNRMVTSPCGHHGTLSVLIHSEEEREAREEFSMHSCKPTNTSKEK